MSPPQARWLSRESFRRCAGLNCKRQTSKSRPMSFRVCPFVFLVPKCNPGMRSNEAGHRKSSAFQRSPEVYCHSDWPPAHHHRSAPKFIAREPIPTVLQRRAASAGRIPRYSGEIRRPEGGNCSFWAADDSDERNIPIFLNGAIAGGWILRVLASGQSPTLEYRGNHPSDDKSCWLQSGFSLRRMVWHRVCYTAAHQVCGKSKEARAMKCQPGGLKAISRW